MALYTLPRHEKAVARYLQYSGIEQYLPLVKSRRHWRNRQRVEVEEPLFQCYVFARAKRQECWRAEAAPGVVRAVRVGSDPAVVEDQEIRSLQGNLALRNAQPHPYLVVGKKARILTGAFAGQEGILVRKQPNFTVVLSLRHLPMSFSIEVSGDEVETVA